MIKRLFCVCLGGGANNIIMIIDLSKFFSSMHA